MDLDLTDEQRLIQETAREFADREIAPRARDNDRAGRFDRELASKIGEIGYLGAPVAEEYGGRGLDYVTYGLIVEQVGRATAPRAPWCRFRPRSCAARSSAGAPRSRSASGCPGCAPVRRSGASRSPSPTPDRMRPRFAHARPAATAGWVISGQKMFISLGNYAELALVFAQTDPEKGYRGLACFLVPTSDDGYHAQEIHGKLGLRASDTASISLEDVEVPDDAMLGEVGDGFKVAMSALDNGRYSVAAGCVGICEGCVDASVSYSTERKQFGVPVARFQLVQELIAEMVMKRDAARLLVRRAGILKDKGEPNTVETSIAKLYATEAAVECANAAIQVHGGSGYVDDHPVERYLRDARVTTLYEGTSQIQKLIIGRGATGIDAMRPMRADDG